MWWLHVKWEGLQFEYFIDIKSTVNDWSPSTAVSHIDILECGIGVENFPFSDKQQATMSVRSGAANEKSTEILSGGNKNNSSKLSQGMMWQIHLKLMFICMHNCHPAHHKQMADIFL